MQDIKNILTLQNIIIYFIIINIIGFLAMYIDKQKAKKGKWRIPEKTLLIVALLGGSIGTISGMYLFRHKTKKLKFKLVYLFCFIYLIFISFGLVY